MGKRWALVGFAVLNIVAFVTMLLPSGGIGASASSPASQQATVPAQPGKIVKITWTGTILPGVNATSECSLGTPNEDHHQVKILVAPNAYTRVLASATFGIAWTPAPNAQASDEILTLIGPDGQVIDSSDGGDPSESVTVANPLGGTYDAVACGFTNAGPKSYTGTLTIRTVALPRRAATCNVPAPPKVSFVPPVYVDQDRAGGEPVSVVAQDGSIIVSTHAGTTHLYKNPAAIPGASDYAVGYFNQTLNWRSTDGGATWQYVGTFGNPVVGPHTLTSTGFSDPDLTMDAGGRIYNAEIDLANVSVYSSNDDGQSFHRANPIATSGDRPWVLGKDPDEVFLTVSGGELKRSTDGGLTFQTVTTESLGQGKLLNDPLNPAGIIAPYSDADHNAGVAISPDRGKTWKGYPLQLGKSTQFFSTVGVDRAGWIYTVAAGGYEGAGDAKPDGQVTFSYFDRKTKKWAPPVEVPAPKGDALWPWIIAGDDGRVAIVWYQSLAKAPERWYVYHAYTLNGHGTRVKCAGRTVLAPPSFRVTNASGRTIHDHPICLLGTACVAAPNPENSDRRLGDFFTVNYDLHGTMFIASGDTKLTNPLGGPKIVSNPIFIRQMSGPRLLLHALKARATRPLCPPPCLP
jgi:hypothetical protein